MFQYLIDLFAKPNFMWWCIGAIIDKEKAMDDFAPPETTQVYIPPAAAPIIPQQASIMSNSNQPTFQNDENENLDYLRNPSNSVYSLRNPLYEGNNVGKSEYIYFEILNIKIVDTEISVELKSGKEFTLYNIQVC